MERISEILKRVVPQGERPVSPLQSLVDEVKCLVCKDVGYLHPVIDGKVDYGQIIYCVCRLDEMRRQKREAMMRLCQLPARSDDWTFEKFNTYDNPILTEAYNSSIQLANEEGNIRWLTLLGDWDRGKTHLLVAICRQWLARERPARYAYVPLLLKELRRGFEEKGEYDRLFDFFCQVPLLALDDLGVEKQTPWVMQELDTIVDYRVANALPLVITSNLALDELPPRIGSRIRRETWCQVIEMNVPEYSRRDNGS